ncbi:FHA domain-containing protein [Hyalangium gracile]|uniref:FHA domain-containing protein n=1 Tax=Hyalangium gracile TaxID=394092 RepID=UPI00389933E0
MGRTSENDLVLHDQGVSRRHARIFTRGGRSFVEDLGSTGGTLCDGRPLARAQERELRGGERLAIGAVEFIFSPLKTQASASSSPVTAPAARPRSSTLVTRAQTVQEMQAIEREDTGRHRTLLEVELKGVDPAPTEVMTQQAVLEAAARAMAVPAAPTTIIPQQAVLKAAALAKAAAAASEDSDSTSTVTRVTEPPLPRGAQRPSAASPAASGPSAAERARLRRQRGNSLGGKLLSWWEELSPRHRSIAGVVAGLVIVAVVGVLVVVLGPEQGTARPQGPEPAELGFTPIADSFGLGQGVTWTQPDQKTFHFQYASPTRALAVLHYQARDVASAHELAISLNGAALGWVPQDNLEADERELQMMLPIHLLHRDQPNQLSFDSVLNPPGKDPWRVWNVYVEVIPVPELPAEQLLAKASKEADAGRRFYEQKDVGSENLFKSWKLFRSAWLTLEALDQKPELHADVLFMLAQTAQELDRQCRLLMLDFQRSLQYRDGDKARATVEEVMRRFPTTEHRCHNLALEKANQYELPI